MSGVAASIFAVILHEEHPAGVGGHHRRSRSGGRRWLHLRLPVHPVQRPQLCHHAGGTACAARCPARNPRPGRRLSTSRRRRFMVQFGQAWYLPPAVAYVLVVIAAGGYFLRGCSAARPQRGRFVDTGYARVWSVQALVLLVLSWGCWSTYLGTYASGGVCDGVRLPRPPRRHHEYALTRTRWGRAVFAVGGNVEAARRAGIRVNRVYVSVFVLCAIPSRRSAACMAIGQLGARRPSRAVPATSTWTPSPQRSSAEPASSVAAVPPGRRCSASWSSRRFERPAVLMSLNVRLAVHRHRPRAAAGRHRRLAVAPLACGGRSRLGTRSPEHQVRETLPQLRSGRSIRGRCLFAGKFYRRIEA